MSWEGRLDAPHTLIRQRRPSRSAQRNQPAEDTALSLPEDGRADFERDRRAVRSALYALFADRGFPEGYPEAEVQLRRDPLGRPYVTWRDGVEAWAEQNGLRSSHLHVSNTHDGEAHLLLAAYAERLVGAGIDTVYLPRLRRAGKDAAYLRRFARQFMSAEEWARFQARSDTEDEEALRQRVAAHFSLMEAASKACGTGLKIGVGMGRATSLPMHSLGVDLLEEPVRLLFGTEARRRLETLGAVEAAAHWCVEEDASGDYVTSVVLLWKGR